MPTGFRRPAADPCGSTSPPPCVIIALAVAPHFRRRARALGQEGRVTNVTGPIGPHRPAATAPVIALVPRRAAPRSTETTDIPPTICRCLPSSRERLRSTRASSASRRHVDRVVTPEQRSRSSARHLIRHDRARCRRRGGVDRNGRPNSGDRGGSFSTRQRGRRPCARVEARLERRPRRSARRGAMDDAHAAGFGQASRSDTPGLASAGFQVRNRAPAQSSSSTFRSPIRRALRRQDDIGRDLILSPSARGDDRAILPAPSNPCLAAPRTP